MRNPLQINIKNKLTDINKYNSYFMSNRPLLSMPWPFIYDSHNTMVNRKRQHLIQSAKLCTVCTGLQAQCNATGVTHNSRSRLSPRGEMGLEFSVSGTLTPGLCETNINLNNTSSPEQQMPYLKMYPQEARVICKDAHDFFASLNHNVQYAFNNNDKMTCTLIFDNKK